MANKLKCRHCGERKDRESGIRVPLGFFCSRDHAISYGRNAAKKKRDKFLEAKEKRELKDRKLAIKPKSKHLEELQTLVNKYVRLRDKDLGCISCDKTKDWGGQWHAGHYFSRGHSSYLRFNLHNIHKQCSVCNMRLSANIERYRPRLIAKIGVDNYERLVCDKSKLLEIDIEKINRAKTIVNKALVKFKIS